MKSLATQSIVSISLVTLLCLTPVSFGAKSDRSQSPGLSNFSVSNKSPDAKVPPTPEKTATSETQGATPVGRVVWIKGNLSATTGKTERPLQKLSVIYLKDTLKTDNNSQAQIVFTDNTLMTFKPNSKFLIDQYQFNAQKPNSAGKYVMNLIQGGFRTITGLIAKQNPANYQVKTPVATIGVRGTDYAVYLDSNGKLFMSNYHGTPCMSNPAGGMCLNDKNRFAQVSSQNSAPVRLLQMPAGFKEKLDVVPAKISTTPGPTTGGSGSTGSGTSTGATGTSTGTTSTGATGTSTGTSSSGDSTSTGDGTTTTGTGTSTGDSTTTDVSGTSSSGSNSSSNSGDLGGGFCIQ